MEDNQIINADYQIGFNEGYLLAQNAPEIAETLSKVESKAERIKGFKDGRNEYLKEKDKDFLPDWFKEDIVSKTHVKNKDQKNIDKE